jgi:N-acetyl sugar amidotransferase
MSNLQKFVDLLYKKLEEPKLKKNYRQCSRCFMDTTAEGIKFDENGVCNYCREFEELLKKPKKKLDLNLNEFVQKIKEEGKNKKYDCIVGISGGVDSAYTLVKVKELGLRPLAVHMDNGWNSELAANNIKNLVEKLGVDLYTHVIDWDEYRELMQAFFDADVIDIELLYDNAMLAVNYQQAKKYGIKYILSGSNTANEGMKIPKNWNWFKMDKKNIYNLAKRNSVKIKTFPAFGTIDYIFYEFLLGIRWYPFLDYLKNYNKYEALELLKKEYGYKPYPYKHYESIFTRFYQGYILPVKFGVDKRKVHISTLYIAGQISKEEAIKQLLGIPYPSEKELIEDLEYFLKKMKWTEDEFYEYLLRPEKSHRIYGTEVDFYNLLLKIYKKVKNYKLF